MVRQRRCVEQREVDALSELGAHRVRRITEEHHRAIGCASEDDVSVGREDELARLIPRQEIAELQILSIKTHVAILDEIAGWHNCRVDWYAWLADIQRAVPEKIQLTRTLLYIGAVQASRANSPGLTPLDHRMQQGLMRGLTSNKDVLAA